MGLDYYAILDVPRDATTLEIKLAYRKWSPICHPLRKNIVCDIESEFPELCATNENRPCSGLNDSSYWKYLHEAYDVLSNPLSREVYNLYGEEGLKKGVPTNWGFFHPYAFHGDCHKIYREFFASYSPFADLIDAVTNPPPLTLNSDGKLIKKVKDKDIEEVLDITLEEVYKGDNKKIKIMRHEFIDDAKTKTEIREKWLKVPIKRGIESGTVIRFPDEGDRNPTRFPGDVVITINVKNHETFKRDKENLYMTHKISLKEALCDFSLKIHTLDDRILRIKVTDTISPTYNTIIEGEGLPVTDCPAKFGNLIVNYEIEFPKYIPKAIKTQFAELFDKL
uniref:CSON006649 protein n=1 Tax=Culicoides sonorensis TaxID=179676 RepID=A0A336LBJ9_CULSO